jgi:signal transduction histidine kinase
MRARIAAGHASDVPPLASGIVVAVALIAVETLVGYPLRTIAPQISLGAVYLLGVLVVSTVWGLGLGVVTSVLSIAAFDFFHVPPTFTFVPGDPEGPAALAILFVVELLLSAVAALARSRAIEVDERCAEADLAAEMARVLLRAEDLRSALPGASARLARTLGLPAAAIELEAVEGGEGRAAFALRDGGASLGTLLVPAELPAGTERRVRERVVPAVEALLRAAREREAMGSALKTSRDELRVLAGEQAALRRVATVVARGAPPEEVFAAATEEIGQLLPVEHVYLGRYEPDGTVSFVTAWGSSGANLAPGGPMPLGGKNLSTIVFETGRPARIESYADATGPVGVAARDGALRSGVATPVIVEGRLWGVMAAGSSGEATWADVEARLAGFTELLATAIGNAESRASLARLAEEQAALRRVATLVAHGAPPEELFAAVTEEVARLFPVDLAGMGRYEPDGTLTVVASWGGAVELFPVGARLVLGGQNLLTIVHETGRPCRMDGYAEASGAIGIDARKTGFRSSVGTPIIVEGRLWGLVAAGSSGEQALPADTEARLTDFTELVATAVANAESRAALAASRARVVAAADETRLRIERDLHDGIQQRLVALTLELRAAQAAVPPELAELEGELSRVAERLASVFDELREIAREIHPAILSKGGLDPAIRVLARRCTVPVQLDLHVARRPPRPLEVAAYDVVSEALSNAAKHAQASEVHVELQARDTTVRLEIHDDGIGGADPARGSGLVGLSDRVEALGGTLKITSPAGRGTRLVIELPLEQRAIARAVGDV